MSALPPSISISEPATLTPTTSTAVSSTESTLIYRVKEASDSAALTVLVDSHTGIYVDVVSRYSQAYPNVIKRDDLVEDRLYNMYRFIIDYDPARGTKLSTYICDRTDYMCKTLLKKDRTNPITAGTYGPGGALSLGTVGDTYTTSVGTNITLVDEGSESQVIDNADKDLRIDDILVTAKRWCSDERFIQILGYRFFNKPKTCLSWRAIGRLMGLSHERVRIIYNENLEVVKRKMRGCSV